MEPAPDGIRVTHSAHGHGVAAADILHAYRNAISSRPLEDGEVMLVGPAHNAEFYELGVSYDADTDSVVILHAMLARPRFLR